MAKEENKTYTRKEYLEWWKEHIDKNIVGIFSEGVVITALLSNGIRRFGYLTREKKKIGLKRK